MTTRWNDRLALWNWRSSIVSAALLGMVIVSALGAWSVRASWLNHQRAVEQTLNEYAAYAARTFYQSVASETIALRYASTSVITGAAAYPDDRLTLGRFASFVRGVLNPRIAYATDPGRGFYRVDWSTGGYEATGRAAELAVAEVLREVIRSLRPLFDTAAVGSASFLPNDGGERVSTHFGLQRTSSGQPVAVYGYTISWRESFVRIMVNSIPRMMLLPPSVVGPTVSTTVVPRMDTLVSLRMVAEDGAVYYETPVQFASSASAAFTGFRPPMTIQATLHPGLVTRLRREMLDDDRERLQLALPIVSVLFAIAAILHIRRERELVRARRDFVASVSHELRTPLAQIRMFSETLLLRREESDEERLRWLGIIGREARRLGDLVENILLFSHIDAARVRLEPERTDLGELVEEVVEAYVPIAESRRMRIVADAPSRIFAVVDPRALRQVVVNLIDNALKYGPAGQTVVVELERDERAARLSVADQGAGIPPADRARLWKPFVRLTTGSTAGGSGIGLSVVRSLVQQHGGDVAVHDAAGGGARFVVTLPLAGDQQQAAVQRAAALSQV